MTDKKVPHVFTAIAAVRAEINKSGLAKENEVTDGVRFKFRGIDDTLNAFSGPMERAGLMVIPGYSELTVVARPTKHGQTYNSTVLGHYVMASTIDGSTLAGGTFYGEANDTQDKSIAKAQSIALRQFFLQTFVVPLGAEMDPENTVHDEPASGPVEPKVSQPARKVEGEVLPPAPDPTDDPSALSTSQKRIISSTSKLKGVSGKDITEKYGRVTNDNYNEVLTWINKGGNNAA